MIFEENGDMVFENADELAAWLNEVLVEVQQENDENMLMEQQNETE